MYEVEGNTNLDTHSLEVVQSINKTGNITSMAHLIRVKVVFEQCAVNIIVGRVAVDEAIQEESIEWESPVVWGRMIFSRVIWPFSPVIRRICCGLVLVEVVIQPGLVVGPACCGGGEEHRQPAGC